jgi:hypothetical protein
VLECASNYEVYIVWVEQECKVIVLITLHFNAEARKSRSSTL